MKAFSVIFTFVSGALVGVLFLNTFQKPVVMERIIERVIERPVIEIVHDVEYRTRTIYKSRPFSKNVCNPVINNIFVDNRVLASPVDIAPNEDDRKNTIMLIGGVGDTGYTADRNPNQSLIFVSPSKGIVYGAQYIRREGKFSFTGGVIPTNSIIFGGIGHNF
jgi:hypothetical protein